VLLANSQKAHVTYEVIFIDDGSTDDTRDILRGFKFRYVYQENQGKGAAVKKGAEFANGDFLIVLDADGEYLVSDVCKMAEAISENPLASIYGSRYLVDKFVPIRVLPLPNQSILNLYFNYLLSLIIYLRFQMFISDSLTGLKLYSKRVYDWINPKTTGFETDHEISLFLIRNEIPIKEIAIDYFARTKAQGKKISTKDAFKALSLWLR
jgi:glycosyltransferase involved in cell wall biosynthesis